MTHEVEIPVLGPFSLAAAQDFAGGFTAGIGGGSVGASSIVMSFPVDGRDTSAAVEVEQLADGRILARTDAETRDVETVVRQAARCLSLDHDGAGWPAVGRRDPVIARLQAAHDFLRPVCFYSAYEAATSFVIGQRISMRQSARIKERLREEHGDRPTVRGVPYAAFPRPARLLELDSIGGVSASKVEWLHGLARAALDGRLDTEQLRRMERSDALAALRSLRGVGEWTADAIRVRGCGVADDLPAADPRTAEAVGELYELGGPADRPTLERIAEAWRPYRMWGVVLVRVGWNRQAPRTDSPTRRSYRRG